MRKKNSEFDDLIRKKMADLHAAYDPMSWHMLQRKMNRVANAGQSAADDDRFDKLVANKVSQVKPAYQRASWHKLATRLDQYDSIVGLIHRAKTIEVAIACFLLLLLGQSPNVIPGGDAPLNPGASPAITPAQAAADAPPRGVAQGYYRC